jgi:hypothetical protein
MQIEYLSEGGIAYFPGLAKPTVFDTESLPAEANKELKQLVEAAGFFDLPAQVGSFPKGGADMRSHIITVKDGSRSHTVRLMEPVEDDSVKALLKAIQNDVRTIKTQK